MTISFPRLEAGFYPTPLEAMPRLRAHLGAGCPEILIKRDDYTGAGFGGNKIRKIEYMLADARAQGADTVITMGGVRSNHARATAALCARFGFRCVLVLNQTRAVPDRPASLYLDALYGAEIIRVADRSERQPTADRIASELAAQGRKAYVIPLGASVPLGALGFVKAAGELAAQTHDVNWIYHCSSSGGTQAGLEVGLRANGMESTKLVGVSPDDSSASIAAHVAEIAAGTAKLLEIGWTPRAIHVDDGFVGEGYGVPTPEATAALELVARLEGAVLDPVYTAKTMAALFAHIREGRFRPTDRVVFWHTGGQIALFTTP